MAMSNSNSNNVVRGGRIANVVMLGLAMTWVVGDAVSVRTVNALKLKAVDPQPQRQKIDDAEVEVYSSLMGDISNFEAKKFASGDKRASMNTPTQNRDAWHVLAESNTERQMALKMQAAEAARKAEQARVTRLTRRVQEAQRPYYDGDDDEDDAGSEEALRRRREDVAATGPILSTVRKVQHPDGDDTNLDTPIPYVQLLAISRQNRPSVRIGAFLGRYPGLQWLLLAALIVLCVWVIGTLVQTRCCQGGSVAWSS